MRRRGGRRYKGRGIFDFLKKAVGFAGKHKLVSRGAKLAGEMGLPFSDIIGNVAGAFGLGRGKRKCNRYCRRKGGSLRLAGGALGLAGGRRRRAKY
jgi:hypothetical protein